MIDPKNEILFCEYCKTCKHKLCDCEDEPCCDCLATPVNYYSHKPVLWEGVDTLFNKPVERRNHEVERAVREAVYLKASDTAEAIGKQSNLESRVHMRDLISCAINCISDTCKGVTYTYGQMEDMLHSIITGEFYSDEKVITEDLTLGYKRWTSADLPNATEIGPSAFAGCRGFDTLNIPKVTKIGPMAFSYCSQIPFTSDDYFQNIEAIGDFAFDGSEFYQDFEASEGLKFPKLTYAGVQSFGNNSSLSWIFLDVIQVITDFMFVDSTRLDIVVAPNATEIGPSAFAGCTSLSFDGYPEPMPNVTKIGGFAFNNCVNLNFVSFKKVTEVGIGAFANCFYLRSINLPSLVTIGDNAFVSCTNLGRIDIPNVKTIGKCAFENCFSLDEVYLENVTYIDSRAFANCKSLRSILLDKVESVPELVSTEGWPGSWSMLISVPLDLYEQFITHPVWGQYWDSIIPSDEDVSIAESISITFDGPGKISDLYGRIIGYPDKFVGIVYYFNPSSFQDKPSSQYYYMIEPFEEDGYDVLSLIDNNVDCTDSLETIYTDIPMFKIENVDNASYGFVEDSSGWYVSQNKGVKSSAALCKVVFNTTEATTIKFKAINYAESNYDYGIFGAIDATLSTTSTADASSKIFWNGKSQHSASEIEITYQVPAGEHFIYIKYLKDGSADKNNDCLKFKITTENKVVRRTKKYKYTIDLSADAISHDVHVVFAEKKAEETPTETTN